MLIEIWPNFQYLQQGCNLGASKAWDSIINREKWLSIEVAEYCEQEEQ